MVALARLGTRLGTAMEARTALVRAMVSADVGVLAGGLEVRVLAAARGVRVLARAPETRALRYRHFLETNKQLFAAALEARHDTSLAGREPVRTRSWPSIAVGDRGGSLERDLARTTFFGTLSDAFSTCTLHNSNGGFFRHCVIAASSEHSATGVTHQLHCVWHCRLTHCRISQPVRTPQLQRYQKCQLLLISCRPGIRNADA
jgi:hypothetical protein